MRSKLFSFSLYCFAIIGLAASISWGASLLASGLKVQVLKVSDSIRVEFSDTDDRIEIYNYSEMPFPHKDIAVIVDGEMISAISIHGDHDREKWVEMTFEKHVDGNSVIVFHERSNGIPSYRIITAEDGRPRKEYLSEIVWSSEPEELRESVLSGSGK